MDHASLPSPAQLALAMVIVKQKPAGQDISGYIVQIRNHIKNAENNDKGYPQDRFFDSVAFWQQAYEKSEAEQIKLLDLIYELERRNEVLQAKLQTPDTSIEKDQGPSKRKATDGKNVTGARKSTKTQTYYRAGMSNTDPALRDDRIGSFEYLDQSIGPFMRHFYALHKVLQKRPSHAETVQAALILCKTAAGSILNATSQRLAINRSKKAPLQSNQPNISAVLRSIECAFQLLCQALRKLSRSELAGRDADQVTYHIVCLYGSIMDALQQQCKLKSEQTSTSSKPTARLSKRKQTMKPAQTQTSQPSPGDEIVTQITWLLNTMALSLDLSCTGHRDLLEGFLCILLSRVGKILCLFVFQDLQLRPGLHIDPVQLPLPGGLAEMSFDGKSQYAAQMEAKQLIWLLEKVLAMLDANPSMSSSQISNDGSASNLFVSKIKGRLQGTLMQAVFGTNTAWGTVLKRPIQPEHQDNDSLQACSRIPEQNVPDWFIQEVWRLLGWEILVNGDVSEK